MLQLSDTVDTITSPEFSIWGGDRFRFLNENWNVTDYVPFDILWTGQGGPEVSICIQAVQRNGNSTSPEILGSDQLVSGYSTLLGECWSLFFLSYLNKTSKLTYPDSAY